MSMNYCVWLKDYTEGDIEPFASLLDHEMPIPYGFVIPRAILTSIYLAPEIQSKMIPLFESSSQNIDHERQHIVKLIEKIVKGAKTPKGFFSSISSSYEHLHEMENEFHKRETTDLHRAIFTLKHVYKPATVRVSLLPVSRHEILCRGEIAIEHAIIEIITKYFESYVGSHAPTSLPSILIQRVLSAQVCGSCTTVNHSGNRNDQMVIHAFFGTKELEEAGDVYIVQKDTADIVTKYSSEQPFKYVLKGTKWKEVPIHPQDAKAFVLTDSQIQKISYLSKDFEKEVYFPQKISFAFENGKLFVTKRKAV